MITIKKLIKKTILPLICVLIVLNIMSIPRAYSKIVDNDNPEKFYISHVARKDSVLSISGVFINCSKDRVYNFKDITFTVKDPSLNISLTYALNSTELKDIDLPAGNTTNEFTFKIEDDKLKKINTNRLIITSKFDYLTQFNNSYDKGFHVFYKNEELQLDNKPYMDNQNKIYIPAELLSNLKNILKTKEPKLSKIPSKKSASLPQDSAAALNDFLKKYPPVKSIVTPSNQLYVQLDSVNLLLTPRATIFTFTSNDYSSIIFYTK